MTPAELVASVRSGERRPLARLLTAIEAGDASVREALPALFAAGSGGHVVGITGPPGSGKSTLVSALIGEWRRRARRVGVLAVDPSSPYTRGAILGDRVRMMEHAADRDVFMRSMASRGELGGLASTTWIAAAALDAAGYDPILIETVGAGQSEVEVARVAETTVVVEVPEMGDEIQAIKAGLLEVADVLVVNKSDRPGADRAARQLRAMLSTAGGRVTRKPPPILLTSATTGEGVVALADAVDAHRSKARSPAAARDRAAHQVRRALADLAATRAAGDPDWERVVQQIADRGLDPLSAAEALWTRAAPDHHLATIALRNQSPGTLILGLVGAANLPASEDPRDIMVSLAPYVDAARRLGLEPSVVFDRAAASSDGRHADLLRDFGRRDISLDAFGWKVVELPEGPAYRSTHS
jgi:LAO/AO transport system kinase